MTIVSFSHCTLLFGIVLALLRNDVTIPSCHAIALIESSCYMKLTFPTTNKNDIITVEDAAIIESSMITYFYKLFIAPNDSNNNNNDNNPMYSIPMDDNSANAPRIVRQPLQFHVDVADSILIGNIATITAQVSFLYEAKSSMMVLESPMLAETFTRVYFQGDTATTASATFSTFTTDPSLVTILFTSNENNNSTSSILLKDDYRNNNGNNYTSKEVALIVVTVFLSIVLLIVSSVLLHITGGWNVCTNAMSNCLFEEIDDDEDENNNYYRKKAEPQPQEYIQSQPTRTFPLQHSQDQGEEQEVTGTNTNDQHEDEEDTNFLDVESVMTSVLPTSASGLLGVSRNKDAVAIHTMMDDDDDDEESNIYGDGMTPVSRSQINNNEPLGITSMRKLQPMSDIDHKGGFSSGIRMLQNRLLRSASKKEMTPN